MDIGGGDIKLFVFIVLIGFSIKRVLAGVHISILLIPFSIRLIEKKES
jgi:Na+/H+ antiporter NhaD/arsenite permease-like protein